MKTRNLNQSFIKAFVICLFLFFIQSLNAQTIRGRVLDGSTGDALVGATVSWDKTHGTITNQKGEFEISDIKSQKLTIAISFIGYKPVAEEITINNQLITKEFLLTPVRLEAGEVVITATRTENLIKDVPARINIIGKKELKNLPARSVDELLTFVPGIQISRPYGVLTSRATVSLRGLGGKEQSRTLVMIDGIPVNKTDGGTVNWNLINNGNIERIEVTKGPGSALYGGNAMGGIINVITRKPTDEIEGNASLEYSTFNTPGAALNLGGRMNPAKKDGFYWNINGFTRSSDGYITQPQRDITRYTVKSDMHEIMGGIRLGYDFNEARNLETDIRYYDDVRSTGEKVYQPDGNAASYGTLHFRTCYRDRIGKYNLTATVFAMFEDYQKVNEYMRDNSYTYYDVDSKRNDAGALFNISRKAGELNLLTAGVDVRRGSVDASDIYYTSTDKINNRGSMDFAACYIQDEIKVMKERGKIVAGIRFDFARFFDGSFNIENPSAANGFMKPYQIPVIDETSWNAISPRIAFQYHLTESTRAYASFSRGFRPSILDDMCRSGRIKGGFKIANPNLKPETMNNYETGFDTRFRSWLNLSASFYYSEGFDFMYYTSTGQTIDMGYAVNPVSMRENISKVAIYGAEAEVTARINKNLNLFINYAYTHAQIKDYTVVNPMIDINLTNKFLTDVAPHLVSSGVNFSSSRINASIYCKYTGKMWINDSNGFEDLYLMAYQYPSLLQVDGRVSARLYRKFSTSVSVQNIGDVKYYDSKGMVNPGRIITLTLTATL